MNDYQMKIISKVTIHCLEHEDIDYTCPLCDQEFSSPDYDMKEVWYEPTSDGHFNAYITRFCPHCNENASVAV